MYVCAYMPCWHAHVCVCHMEWVPKRTKEGIRSLRAGITDSYEVDGSVVKHLSVLAENLSSVARTGR